MEAARRPVPLAALALLGLALLSSTSLASDAALHAERIDEGNATRLLPGGADAIGGLGDWALGNGTLCAVVSDISHESILSVQGGLLVDLAHCDRDDDQFHVLQPLLNVSQDQVPTIHAISTRIAEGAAQVVTEASYAGVSLTTSYALNLSDPHALRIRSELHRMSEGPRVRVMGDVVLHGNGSLSAFTISTQRPDRTLGFAHPRVDPDQPLEMIRAIVPADLHVWVGAPLRESGIAYGLRLISAELLSAEGEPQPLPRFSINGVDFSLLGILSRPSWSGERREVGPLELAQALFMNIRVGETLRYEREIRVGSRSDVASVTDQLWSGEPRVTGRVDDPATQLHVDRIDGTPVTHVRPDQDGRFGFRIPSGSYRLRALAPGGRSLERSFLVAEGETALEPLTVGAPSRVRLPRDRAMRLVFAGAGATPDPRFGETLLGFRIGEDEVPTALVTNDVSLTGAPGDPEEIVIPAGRYQVFASRGPEFDIERVTLSLAPGENISLEIGVPKRALTTPGWISADLHVHAVGSDDSNLPLRTRIDTLVAQGIDVVVSTEHDQLVDYGPLIADLGLAERLASVVGVEITSTARDTSVPYTAGHMNAFPLTPRPENHRDGAPRGEGVRIREIVRSIRSLGGARLVQMNHPRGASLDEDASNYFSHLSIPGKSFDATAALEAEPNRVMIERDGDSGLRDLDFDAVELMNGPSMVGYYRTRADWFSLLLQGEFRTATANSDSHRLGEIVGIPRNYVRMTDDAVDGFDEESFIRALRQGRVYGTTGPVLDVTLEDVELGERFSGEAGTLRVAVEAAPWIPVSTLRVYVNAALARELPIAAGETRELDLQFERDSFVTVEVLGEADASFAALNPEFASFSFTNPIFVDANRDGHWSAPGLPASLPATIRDPLRDLE
jgi:hypothetical protein